jgi:putative phage-type endonuclease
MPNVDVIQGTDEWLAMRAGMFTASRAKLLVKTKGGKYSEKRGTYLMEVVMGRLTGLNPETYVSAAMEWGITNEPLARAAYENLRDVVVEPGGFSIHPRIEFWGASPDGLIGDDGLLECKCPNTTTHLEYLLTGVVPDDYRPQMIAQMACTGRQWCDFVSYDPRLPKKLRLFVKRLERDEKAISEMESEVTKFLAEVDDLLLRLRQDDPSSLVPQLVKSLEAV